MKIKDLYDEAYMDAYVDRIGEASILSAAAVKALAHDNYQEAIATSLAGLLNMTILRNIHQYNVSCAILMSRLGISAAEADALLGDTGEMTERYLKRKLKRFMEEAEETEEK